MFKVRRVCVLAKIISLRDSAGTVLSGGTDSMLISNLDFKAFMMSRV